MVPGRACCDRLHRDGAYRQHLFGGSFCYVLHRLSRLEGSKRQKGLKVGRWLYHAQEMPRLPISKAQGLKRPGKLGRDDLPDGRAGFRVSLPTPHGFLVFCR